MGFGKALSKSVRSIVVNPPITYQIRFQGPAGRLWEERVGRGPWQPAGTWAARFMGTRGASRHELRKMELSVRMRRSRVERDIVHGRLWAWGYRLEPAVTLDDVAPLPEGVVLTCRISKNQVPELSAFFGIGSGQLHVCRGCTVWVTRNRRASFCRECAPRVARLRARLDQQVSRGRLSAERRRELLARGVKDLRHIGGIEWTYEDWEKRWFGSDSPAHLPMGRPRKHRRQERPLSPQQRPGIPRRKQASSA
jgi:hypothetical protein